MDVGSRPRVTSHASATGGVRSQKWPRSRKESTPGGCQSREKKAKHTVQLLIANLGINKSVSFAACSQISADMSENSSNSVLADLGLLKFFFQFLLKQTDHFETREKVF